MVRRTKASSDGFDMSTGESAYLKASDVTLKEYAQGEEGEHKSSKASQQCAGWSPPRSAMFASILYNERLFRSTHRKGGCLIYRTSTCIGAMRNRCSPDVQGLDSPSVLHHPFVEGIRHADGALSCTARPLLWASAPPRKHSTHLTTMRYIGAIKYSSVLRSIVSFASCSLQESGLRAQY